MQRQRTALARPKLFLVSMAVVLLVSAGVNVAGPPPSALAETYAGTFIVGHARIHYEQAQVWAARNRASQTFIDLAPLFWSLAPAHGHVRPEIAYGQSAKETGYGRFGGVIDETFKNPCGLKTTAGGPNDDPNAHQRFPSWEAGVSACIDHLALYAGADGYPRAVTTDPRHFPFLFGTARKVEDLGGKWAPSPDYGHSIMRDYVNKMTGPLSGFDEWILFLNPHTVQVAATLTVERAGSTPYSKLLALPPSSRSSIYVNDLVPSGEASVKINSDLPIVAERAMYFVYNGWPGGHTGDGVTTPHTSWFLAEGHDGHDFDTFVEIYNPGEITTSATATFLLEGGGAVPVPLQIVPRARVTINAASIEGVRDKSFSIAVDADLPVVAERSSYFKYVSPVSGAVMTGGSASRGVPTPLDKWDLAEGYSGPGFDTWTLVANPGSDPVNVTEKYMRNDGVVISDAYVMKPNSRHTRLARTIPQLVGFEHSVRVEADGPIAVERAEYFSYTGPSNLGIREGSSSQAVVGPQPTWYLAEGYTGPGFDTWVLLSNPSDHDALVRLDFLREGMAPTSKEMTVPSKQRVTVNVVSYAGQAGVSTIVSSLNAVPVVAERATYFSYQSPKGWKTKGGGSSAGVAAPSTTWYFAEGYLE